MICGFFPNEPCDERIMVGTFVTLSREPLSLHIAFIEDVVDAEPKTVGVVGDSGS